MRVPALVRLTTIPFSTPAGARISACLVRCAHLYASVGNLEDQVARLRRAQIVEREWKSCESDAVKGALADARAALKAARKG